ncbi:MAG: MarR family transcriptional regulator [Planctomycetes bacterium]|nr:MarR family transcriptional regulator [Planctomycetota bacterium]
MTSDREKNLSESFSDRSLLDYLRRHDASTVNDLMEFAGVTATAIRQRVNRLMEQGLVLQSLVGGQAETRSRGRPTHCYSLTALGERSSGDNFQDLTSVLWSEIRAVKDPEIRQGLLKRIVGRFAETYRDRVQGGDLREKMESLVGLMHERDVPFEVVSNDSGLPVLTAWACPYPELAEQDRAICSMEKMLFSEILGESVRLSACRLDGESCCTFEASPMASSSV